MSVYNIVFSTSHSYAKYTYVAMYSILRQTANEKKIVFHILIDNSFTEEDKKLFNVAEEIFCNSSLKFYLFGESVGRDVGTRIARTTYFRLYIPTIIDADACLYLDQDLLITGDVTELFSFIGDKKIYGVVDPMADLHIERLHHEYSCFDGGKESVQHYINGGVILFNNRVIDVAEWEKQLSSIIDYPFTLGDQDIINILCQGEVGLLPGAYNYNIKRHNPCEHPQIIHYTGPKKPWNYPYYYGANEWWETCLQTEVFDEVLKENAFSQWLYLRSPKIENIEEFVKYSKKHKCIIYGAGKLAREIAAKISTMNDVFIEFAVESKECNPPSIYGYPVKSIHEYEDDEISVFVAVAEGTDEIALNLLRMGFSSVMPIIHLAY